MKSVGIDIGSSAVRMVEVESTTRHMLLRRAVEFPLSIDPSTDNRVGVLEALKRISLSLEPGTRVVVSVNQKLVTARHKVFPFRERQKILKSLPFELEDEVPFSQDTAIFDAKFQGFRGNAAHVLALACARKAIQETLQRAQDGGIDPDLISMESAALSILDEQWDQSPPELPHKNISEENESAQESIDDEPAMVLLHLGHEHSVVSIIHRKTLIAARSIHIGGLHVIRAIQKRYNIPFTEAAKATAERAFVLTSHDKASEDQIQFSNTITSALSELVGELKRTILEVRSEFKVGLRAVEMSGGMGRMINLGPYLTQELEMPCNLRSPFRGWDTGILQIESANEPLFTVALGLALEGQRRPKNPAVNFRRAELSRESSGAKHFFDRWGAPLKMAGLAFVAFFIYSTLRESWTLSLNSTVSAALKRKALAVGLQKNQTSPSAVTKHIRQEEKKIENQKVLSKLQNMNSPIDVLRNLSQGVPGKERIQLDVRRFYVQHEFLTVEGEVGTQDQVLQIRESLKALSVDSQIQDLKPSFQSKTGRPAFAYSLKIKRQLGGAM